GTGAAAELDLAPLAARAGGLDLVLIGASDPEAMLAHTRECATLGMPFAADPSQQLPRLDGPQVRALVDGAAYLFCNEYEEALIERKSGWGSADVLGRGEGRINHPGPGRGPGGGAGGPPRARGAPPRRGQRRPPRARGG